MIIKNICSVLEVTKMPNLIVCHEPDPVDKLRIMREDARYDVADDNKAVPDLTSLKAGFKASQMPPKVPKVFLSNNCIFNCAYCGCRCSNDKRRYLTTPKELAALSVTQARSAGSGIFITSAICKSPDYTQELIIQTLRIIRQDYGYRGYLHAKIMPGADPELIYRTGMLADRMSVNIEVAKSEGYELVAKNKNKNNILTPMGQISGMIQEMRDDSARFKPKFACSQTTQLMAGSTGEDDFTILRLAGALYRKYALKRVYYTAFHYEDPARGYDELPFAATPKWRVARLYQADRLLKLYGFSPEELAPERSPNLARDLDPKAAWALSNLHLFPVEVNKADYETLLRVPGIGITLAKRIVAARRSTTMTFDVLKALGVSLKRSGCFLTCNGKFRGGPCDNPDILRCRLSDSSWEINDQLTFSL
jgi:putative DNA modification/repair radical SAM protein